MHIKSRKFLQLSPKHRARAAGSYRVVLDPKGSEDAWLTLHPRFKFQVEGSPVLNLERARAREGGGVGADGARGQRAR